MDVSLRFNILLFNFINMFLDFSRFLLLHVLFVCLFCEMWRQPVMISDRSPTVSFQLFLPYTIPFLSARVSNDTHWPLQQMIPVPEVLETYLDVSFRSNETNKSCKSRV